MDVWTAAGVLVCVWLVCQIAVGLFAPFQSTRKKLMIGTWGTQSEATIYGFLELDVTKANAYIERVRNETGLRVSITHVVMMALGRAIKEVPAINGRLILSYFFPHKTVDIGCLVALDDGKDLFNVKITDADKKSIKEICEQLQPATHRLREGKDEDHKQVNNTLRILPSFVISFITLVTGFLAGALGLSLPFLGVKPFPFGSAMVTSIGMFGLESACVPFTEYAHVPLIICIGKITEKAVVEEGKIVIRPILSLSASIDHRFVDGAVVGKFNKVFSGIITDPEAADVKKEK